MKSVPEGDYRGEIGGANLYVTFEAHGTIASGSCFYDASGVDVPLRGALDERGVVMLQEMSEKGPVSAVTLSRDPDGAWFGTWASQDESRSGIAHLQPLVRRTGEPVFVATRRVHLEKKCSSASGQLSCGVDERVPVVLGLADRAFERSLNQRLAAIASGLPVMGTTAHIDYTIPLNERGFVSIEISARDGGDATYAAEGLSAALDAAAVARDLSAFVDVPKAQAVLQPLAQRCGQDISHLLPNAAVLTDRGVAIVVEDCRGRTRTLAWDELRFDVLGSSLRKGTPFDAAWSR